MNQLRAPNGRHIVGTKEMVPGCANVNGWTVGADGKLEPDYAGGSEMYWDDSETQRTFVNGEETLIVVDEDGTEWPLAECTVVTESEGEE